MKANEDQPFQHYTLRHEVISWFSRTLFGNLTYTVRHGPLKGMKRSGGLGWIPELGGSSAQLPQDRFFAGVDMSGKVVFDIGAFEGLLTLLFARRARHVVCYEPNPRNCTKLRKNLALNGLQNVTVRQYGLGSEPSQATMVWGPAMPGGSTVAGTGMSTTLEHRRGVRHEDIEITTVDIELAGTGLPQPDLVKIDVEGYELLVLQGARHLLETKRPQLFLEMHGETMREKKRNVRAIVEYLNTVGYRDIQHIESGEAINLQNCEVAARGHLYAKA